MTRKQPLPLILPTFDTRNAPCPTVPVAIAADLVASVEPIGLHSGVSYVHASHGDGAPMCLVTFKPGASRDPTGVWGTVEAITAAWTAASNGEPHEPLPNLNPHEHATRPVRDGKW